MWVFMFPFFSYVFHYLQVRIYLYLNQNARPHTDITKHTHTHTHTHSHAHTHSLTHTLTHTHAHTLTHTLTHTYSHTHSHTHKHTHTYTTPKCPATRPICTRLSLLRYYCRIKYRYIQTILIANINLKLLGNGLDIEA